MVNKVILIGNLGADPEFKQTKSGLPILRLRLATSQSRKDKDGNWQEETQWHTVVCFGKTAEYIAGKAGKGSKLYVEGSIKYESYEGKDGQKKHATSINADVVKLLSGGGAAVAAVESTEAQSEEFDIPF